MSNAVGETLKWATAHRHFLSHLVVMPGWHKVVILLGGLLAVGGTVGRMAANTGDPRVPMTTGAASQTPAGSSGLVDDAPAPQPAQPVPPLASLGGISPHMQGVGLSVVLGFILGWFFRAFIKTMALLTVFVGGGLWLLSHYNILHLTDANIEAIKDRSADTAGWLSSKASTLKDLAVAHLPSSTAGAFGSFLGLRRR